MEFRKIHNFFFIWIKRGIRRCPQNLPSDPEAAAAVVNRAVESFGRLDGVVANVGGGGGQTVPFVDVTREQWQWSIDNNLSSTFFTLQAAARLLVDRGEGGSLIALGSTRAVRLKAGFLPYSTTKSAVHNMTKSIAVELAPHRIRCNTVVPGLTETPATRATADFAERAKSLPMGLLVKPEEIAGLVAYLLCPEARQVSGSVIFCDGTRTLQN